MEDKDPANSAEGKASTAEKIKRGRDFLRYLRTENVNYEGMPISDVKDYFNTQYSTYISQISPLENLPTFNSIFKAMHAYKEIHISEARFFTGPYKTPEFEKPVSDKTSAIDKSSQDDWKRRPVSGTGLANTNKGVLVGGKWKAGDDKGRNTGKNNKGNVTAGQAKVTDGQGVNSADKKAKKKESKHQASRFERAMANMSNNALPLPPRASTSNMVVLSNRRKPVQRRMAVDQHMTMRETVLDKESDKAAGILERHPYIRKKENGNGFMCIACRVDCNSVAEVDRHLSVKRHQVVVVVEGLKQMRLQFVQNKYGTNITLPGLESKDATYFVDIEPNEVHTSALCIANVNEMPVELLHCKMLKACRVYEFDDKYKVADRGGTATIAPGESYMIHVRVQAKAVSTYHASLMFHFKIILRGIPVHYHIVRFISAKCKTSVVEEVKPTSTYKHPPRVAKTSKGTIEIVPGYKLPKMQGDSLQRERELASYLVPGTVRKMTNRGLKYTSGLNQGEQVELSSLRFVLQSPLDMSLHERRFRSLLHFEEIQMEVDIRKYDMEAVTMATYPSNNNLLLLKVPGLFESRPSVLKGDWLYVRICGADGKLSGQEYQGFVHETRLNEVALGFDRRLRDMFMPNMKFSVRFVFNRLPLRLQHRACELAHELGLEPLLFPRKLDNTDTALPELKFYNRVIEGNQEQKLAIQNIVAGTSRPAPYIVFGPPGTGKTVTIVEAMKQVHKLCADCHILACTPSNSAADLITERLLQHVPRSHVLRLNAASRSWLAVPENIKGVCNFDAMTKSYEFPRKTELCRYKIIISTLVTAGRMTSANFPAGHFTHVFIDEAGHAVEPECLIPLAGVIYVKHGGQVVLAGDPKQLGPILRSPLAIKYGLDMSLLERYMETCDIYQATSVDDGHRHYDARVITKLLRNYRSHPAILKVPNELFYDSELIACASMDREKLCRWEGLPVQGVPVFFHGVIGEDMRELRSPSFFNPEEVSVVVKYVTDILTCRTGGINVRQEDIGVITPYRKQVQKLQQVLRGRKYDRVTVGSVEEFQGQERTVIIVSTVRSKPQYMSLDMQYQLGFLKNPKRFNVTLTRAKALLIVIGNPITLCKDKHWREFIHYCRDNGAYCGVEIMDEEEEIDDLVEKLADMNLIDPEVCALQPEVVSQYNEQAWRKEV